MLVQGEGFIQFHFALQLMKCASAVTQIPPLPKGHVQDLIPEVSVIDPN